MNDNVNQNFLISSPNKNWFLKVNVDGGRILELSYKKRIILGTFQRIDGKSGNTHICCPNFGNEGVEEYGLPFHGPGRNSIWALEKKAGDYLIISNVIENIGKYVCKLTIKQKFILENEKFTQDISVKNDGKEAIPVNIAIHNYWNSHNGWDGVKINGVDVSSIVRADAFIDIEKENLIEIPDTGKIRFVCEGMPYARLWTGRKEENGALTYDQEYVCIEPARGRDDENFFGSKESGVNAGEEVNVSQTISFESNGLDK